MSYFHSDNAPWTDFRGALTKYYPNKGPLIGNISSSTSYQTGMAGIDCSGYVAAATEAYAIGAWNGNTCFKPGTGNILNDGHAYTPVRGAPPSGSTTDHAGWSGLQPIDVFVINSTAVKHVLFYDRRKRDGSGIDTLESTTATSNYGVSDNYQGTKAFARRWGDLQGWSWLS